MTAATFSHLPLAAGSALLHSAGRVSVWAITHYFRAPLANTGILAMLTLTAMAGTNALYNQTSRHPAPLFAPAADEVASIVSAPAEVRPAPALRRTAQVPVEEVTTGSVSGQQVVPADPIGNTEVFALQKKLLELKLFEGTVDGYYGPKTANAIRNFELRMGMKPQGALTREVVDAIMHASAIEAVAPQPVRVAEPVVQPQVQPIAQAPVQPVAMPQPLVQQPVAQKPATRQVQTLRIAEPTAQTNDRVLIGPVPSDPVGEVLDAAGNTAAGAFDAVAEIVQDIGDGREPPARQVQSVRPAAQVAPQQVMPKTVASAPVQQALPAASPAPANGTDTALVAKVQRGLASLGFLAGSIDGVPGEATAKAIRNFEVYYNYDVTGEVTPELVGMLKSAGAAI